MTKHILACVDGSMVGTAVCAYSAWASQKLDAPLKFLHVIEKSHTPGTDDLSGSLGFGGSDQLLKELSELDARRHIVAIEHGKAILADAVQRAAKLGVSDALTSQRHDRLLSALLAEQQSSQLFVMGRQGNDHDDDMGVIGSHIENVVRAVHTPILMATGTTATFTEPEKFMVAYDGSASADKAIAELAKGAILRGMSGHVVTVADKSAESERKLAAIKDTLAAAGLEVQTHLIKGAVAEQLVAFQKTHDIQLTVMGAYGHARITEFFVGSNTSKMLAASHGPVLILRG